MKAAKYNIYRIRGLVKVTLFRLLYPAWEPLARLWNSSGRFYCPVCASSIRRFLPTGTPRRENARCPVCTSLERHRLDWLLFKERTGLFDGSVKKMLHIAPEEFLARRFSRIPGLEYLSADMNNPKVMVEMDITDIRYPDNAFSIIYCSHVLEHIPEDRKAMKELYRVLDYNGRAVIKVPVAGDKTFEDPSITDPHEKQRVFGHWDHVRRCGKDYGERLAEAGFCVETLTTTDLVTEAACRQMGLQADEIIYLCSKQSGRH